MSIQKKSLISALKTAKKANLTKEEISFDHARNVVKAQPVVKLAGKTSAALKLASKQSAAAKAVRKFQAAAKTAVKN